MIFLILFVVLILIAAIALYQYDQHRWRKYQIYREIFFQKNPLYLACNSTFAVAIAVPKFSYDRLMNNLMLLNPDQAFVTQACLEKGGERPWDIKVQVNNVMLGYLEKNYAEKLCFDLKGTDFEIGRPISVPALIDLHYLSDAPSRFYISLDLPENAEIAHSIISDQTLEIAQNNYLAKIKPMIVQDDAPEFSK